VPLGSGCSNVNVVGNVISVQLNTDVSSTASTTFNGTAATVTFTAKAPRSGPITITFALGDLGPGAAPTFNVNGNSILATLNTNATGQKTAQQFVTAFNGTAAAFALLTASVNVGGATDITTNAPIPQVVVPAPKPSSAQDVANAIANNVQANALISTTVTGTAAFDVTTTTANNTTVTIHAPVPTTAQQLVTAISANGLASTLLSAAVSSGVAATDITSNTVNNTVLTLGQALFSISQNAGGAGNSAQCVGQPGRRHDLGDANDRHRKSWRPPRGNRRFEPSAVGNRLVRQPLSGLPGKQRNNSEHGDQRRFRPALHVDADLHRPEHRFDQHGRRGQRYQRRGRSPGAVWIAYRDNSAKNIAIKAAGINGLGSFAGERRRSICCKRVWGSPPRFPQYRTQYRHRSGGAVIVAWLQPVVIGTPGVNIEVSYDPDGLGPSFFQSPVQAAQSGVLPGSFISANTVGINAAPQIAWDKTTGVVYLVYLDGIGNDTNVFFKHAQFASGNLGAFSFARRVNDDLTTNSQFMPRISVDNSVGSATQGDAVVTWYDARNAGGADNSVQEFGALISNGGRRSARTCS